MVGPQGTGVRLRSEGTPVSNYSDPLFYARCAGKNFYGCQKDKKVDKFKKNTKYSIRDFVGTLGFLVSSCPAVEYGLVYTKAYERIKCKAFHQNYQNYKGSFSLYDEARLDTKWWKRMGANLNCPI